MVYTGTNKIIVNPATMEKLIEDWLNENHEGGPYTVKDVTQKDGGASYNPKLFEITFTDEPKESQ